MAVTRCEYSFRPADHEHTSLTDRWECPHDAVEDADYCPFHLSPEERDSHGLTPDEVVSLARERIRTGSHDQRVFVGAHIPEIPLTRLRLRSDTSHPIDLRHTTIPGGIDTERAQIESHIDLRHSTVGGFEASSCEFEHGLRCSGARFTDTVQFDEVYVYQDAAAFSGVVFESDAVFDDASFDDTVSFADAEFRAGARFRATRFSGDTQATGDVTEFSSATFGSTVTFELAVFERTDLSDATFDGPVTLSQATVGGDLDLSGAEFGGTVDGQELVANEDVDLSGVVFRGAVDFSGGRFMGGPDIIRRDLECSDAVFEAGCTFTRAVIGNASFDGSRFEGETTFERAEFRQQTAFTGVTFEQPVDFDEVIFDSDVTFAETEFEDTAVFRGSEFRGSTDYLSDDAIFTEALFYSDAQFQDTVFAAANFTRVSFRGDVAFRDASFEELTLHAYSFGDDTYIDLTDATVDDGTITQPTDGWVRVDLTRATLGDVKLTADQLSDERELLDYVRFCDTTFRGFEFSSHTDYLDRNNWNLHAFDAGTGDHDYAVPMGPETIERTYLNAKSSASEMGANKAAGEFRVKRQYYLRQKFLEIATDTAEDLTTRVRNGLRAAENAFLGVTCGYGLRLYRITAVFVLVPLIFGFLFTFGGDPFATDAEQLRSLGALTTLDGLETLAINIYFSYITFLTIGYGNIGPTGPAARFSAAVLVYLNVILAGLLLYALIKRSEV